MSIAPPPASDSVDSAAPMSDSPASSTRPAQSSGNSSGLTEQKFDSSVSPAATYAQAQNASPATTSTREHRTVDILEPSSSELPSHHDRPPRDPTQAAVDDPILSVPPSLNYTLKGRKRWILIFWSLIIFDSVAIPLAVYFGLWYGLTRDQLDANAVFSISTACLGGVSIFEYFLRFYRLWRKGSTCRVLGARRAYLDWFHWNFSIAWVFIMVELIVGTVPHWPPIRLLAMPCSSLLYWFAFQLLVLDGLRLAGVRSPVRISSVNAGARIRPGIYSIIEDVVAVDGSGGTEFRQRLNARFEASFYFRRMLHRLTLFWAFGSLLAATVTTVLIFTLDRDPCYIVGWVLPFVWAGVWAALTVAYVKPCLREEYAKWGSQRSMSHAGRYSISYDRPDIWTGEVPERPAEMAERTV